MTNNESTTTFKIGLTMAGAVSAGSYTAGVIDYLLETLELWEQAKTKNRAIQAQYPTTYLQQAEYNVSIPMHDVQLEVISGASAGGITGTLTAISLLEGIRPINKDNPKREQNKLYQSWVEMSDSETETTLTQLMHTDDIQKNEVESLLNTGPIHIIAENALKLREFHALPNYIAADLDLILTISNLRGIKYMINFQGKDSNSGTTITNHSGFFRYRFKHDQLKSGIPKNEEDLYFVLDLKGTESEQHKAFLRSATLSTGAFPIGLKSQINTIDKEYIKRYTRYIFDREEGIEAVLPDDGERMFAFDSIDGGLINNEPFGYTLKVLKEKCPEIEVQKNFAVIMVDPFPNYDTQEGKYEFKKDIFTIAKRMFSALRNQVMFKQDEIINALDENNRTRFLIAPSRKEAKEEGRWVKVKNALACGAMEGFSGFLNKEFREHDFMLGRQNCQSFLRYHFSIEHSKIEEKFDTPLEKEAVERFEFSVPPRSKNKAGAELFFPIIPDMKVLNAYENKYDTANFGTDAELEYQTFPSISKAAVEKAYNKKISKRIKAVLLNLLPNFGLKLALRFGWRLGLRKKIYTYLMDTVYADLKRQGLLK